MMLKTESETGERRSPRTPYGRVRLARFARVRLLRHALPISLLILRKKNRLFCSLHESRRGRSIFSVRISTISMFNDRGNPSPSPSTTSTDPLPECLQFSKDSSMPASTPLLRAVHLRQPRTRRLRTDGVKKRRSF